ncbi:hypothetical protein Tco_0678742 [Tanacetum coccineum]|uniref:Uncharacterized protein n=1 Tax=Tanacetum coccineum TaxID=301880 RepID=A0ABQ4XGV4_9ASTR
MTIFPEISIRLRHVSQSARVRHNEKILNLGRHKDKDWNANSRLEDHCKRLKHTKHYKMVSKESTRLTPPALVPTVEKADEMILQDILQVSLAEHKSRKEQEARENMELVNKHLASEEIAKMVEGSENVIDDSLPPRNDRTKIPDTNTHIKEQVKKQVPEQVRDQVPVYVAKGLILERQKNKEEMERIADPKPRSIPYLVKIFITLQEEHSKLNFPFAALPKASQLITHLQFDINLKIPC